jgi:hypothetical protein
MAVNVPVTGRDGGVRVEDGEEVRVEVKEVATTRVPVVEAAAAEVCAPVAEVTRHSF